MKNLERTQIWNILSDIEPKAVNGSSFSEPSRFSHSCSDSKIYDDWQWWLRISDTQTKTTHLCPGRKLTDTFLRDLNLNIEVETFLFFDVLTISTFNSQFLFQFQRPSLHSTQFILVQCVFTPPPIDPDILWENGWKGSFRQRIGLKMPF